MGRIAHLVALGDFANTLSSLGVLYKAFCFNTTYKART
jgi:hypothetical protein